MKIIILAIALTGCQTTLKIHDWSSIDWSRMELSDPSSIAAVGYVGYIKWSHDKAKKRAGI
jgi:hypothetical protein